ncbi:MAG: uracil-DNA glycosylase [Candidatus Kapaibacteriota bacterium]
MVRFEEIENFLKFYKEIYGDTLWIDFSYFIDTHSRIASENRTDNTYKPTISHSIDIFSVDDDWYHSTSLTELENRINRCTKCELSKTRTKFVFGSGNPDADIMFIGEAPGAEEDLQGLPFVGRAGQLLTKLLREVGIERKDVFICNILKCRPPNNRKPLPSEIEMCKPYLLKQIEILNPKVIVALGATAIEGLFNIKKKMSELRGSIIYLNKIPVIVTYHPAAILRNPNLQREVIEDFNLLLNKFPSIVKRIK